MKPRFSVRTLLGIVAYAAVAAASITSPAWRYIFSGFWVLIVSAAAISATGRTNEQSVFSRDMVMGCLVGFFVFVVHPIGVTNLPGLLASYGILWTSVDWTLLNMNLEIGFGLILATLALWRHRVLERREKTSG